MQEQQPTPKAKSRRLNIRLSESEWEKIHRLAANTTCRSVSEYARKVLVQKPVKVFYRNKSLDEFMEFATRYLAVLEDFGEKFSLLVDKFSPIQAPPELKKAVMDLLDHYGAFILASNNIKHEIELFIKQCDPRSWPAGESANP